MFRIFLILLQFWIWIYICWAWIQYSLSIGRFVVWWIFLICWGSREPWWLCDLRDWKTLVCSCAVKFATVSFIQNCFIWTPNRKVSGEVTSTSIAYKNCENFLVAILKLDSIKIKKREKKIVLSLKWETIWDKLCTWLEFHYKPLKN